MNLKINGAKNSILPIMVIPCIKKGKYIINNCPNINDVHSMIEILKLLNIKIKFKKNKLFINSTDIIIPSIINFDNKIRASYYLYSVLSYYKKKILQPMPKGCNIGDRKIDIHIDFFQKNNIKTEQFNDYISIDSSNFNTNKSLNYTFKINSVGATINSILLSIIGKGNVILKNCCINPYIYDIINFLKKMNFKIDINKKEKIIKIKKISEDKILNNIEYKIIPDPINTASYIIAHCILSDEKLILKNTNKLLLGYFNNIVEKIGIEINQKSDNLIISKNKLNSFNIETGVFPKLFTDVMPIFCSLGVILENCKIKENIMNNRFIFIEEFKKFNCNFNLINNELTIYKSKFKLLNDYFILKDLRGGFATLILISYFLKKYKNLYIKIDNFEYVKRGYSNIELFLNNYDIEIKYHTKNLISLFSKPKSLHSALGL